MVKKLTAWVTSLFKKKDESSHQVQMVDPMTIHFSLPTINDTLPPNVDASKTTGHHLRIHEDDWRQVEAVSMDWEHQIEEEIESVKRILIQNSNPEDCRAYKSIHVRKLITQPLAVPWEDFLTKIGICEQNISRLSVGSEAGSVRGGFSIQFRDLYVYGQTDQSSIQALCLHRNGRSGLSKAEAENFAAFLVDHNLALIDWSEAEVIHDQPALVQFLQ
jgi:hypothetical protein